jgi:uncharacterized protein with NRDE domain
MCLIAFLLGAEPLHSLTVASNRDEFWSRPTLPLQAWTGPRGPVIYSGRDGLAGGTWLGVSAVGRVAMLTNVRAGKAEDAPRSRGELTTRWLTGQTKDTTEFLECTTPDAYGGFNVVLGDMASKTPWVWLSNKPPADDLYQRNTQRLPLPQGWWGRELLPGTYTLSNASLNSPWPKSQRLQRALTEAVTSCPDDLEKQQSVLFSELMNKQSAPDDQLPHTGVPLDLERGLSSPFVHLPDRHYGTRSSLLVWANAQSAQMREWTHPPELKSTSIRTGDAGGATNGPLETEHYKQISISTWGIPASS